MDGRKESHPAHLELGDLYSVGWHGVRIDEKNTAGIDDEIFLECVVCQYWSERIDEAWRRHQNDLMKVHLERLLEEHQKRGACARRLPAILTELNHASTRLLQPPT